EEWDEKIKDGEDEGKGSGEGKKKKKKTREARRIWRRQKEVDTEMEIQALDIYTHSSAGSDSEGVGLEEMYSEEVKEAKKRWEEWINDPWYRPVVYYKLTGKVNEVFDECWDIRRRKAIQSFAKRYILGDTL